MDNNIKEDIKNYIHLIIQQIENNLNGYHFLCHGLGGESLFSPRHIQYTRFLKENKPTPTLYPDIYNHPLYIKTTWGAAWWNYPVYTSQNMSDTNTQKILFLKELLKKL